MKIEVLLSMINVKEDDLDKLNIISKCLVINKCDIEDISIYNNYIIYSYNDTFLSNNLNKGLDKVEEDIILLGDNRITYNENYEELILDEFKRNPKADMIIFNVSSSNKNSRRINRNKKLHLFDSIGYNYYRIAFRRESIIKKKIVFNNLFGKGALYNSGEDTVFIGDFIRNKLKVYLSCKYIGTIDDNDNTSYDDKYFFDKGALCTSISIRFRKLLMLRYLIRNRKKLKNIKFKRAYNNMKKGSIDYLERTYGYEK